MKKRVVLLTMFLILLFIPVIANADIGMPMLVEYDAIVSNTNGATVYTSSYGNGQNSGRVLPYGTKVTVFMETNGNAYIAEQGKENDYNTWVSISDVKGLEDIDLGKYELLKHDIKMCAYKEGAYLYKGPSTTFDKVDGNVMIEVGDTVKILYDSGNDEFATSEWGFVNYKGVSGWVYYYQLAPTSGSLGLSSMAMKESREREFLVVEDNVPLYTSPTQESETGIKIPKGTKLKYNYYYNIAHEYCMAAVEYNGTKGWICMVSGAKELDDTYLFVTDKTRSKFSETYGGEVSQEVISKIENGQRYKVKYYNTNNEHEIVVLEFDGKEYYCDFGGIGDMEEDLGYVLDGEYLDRYITVGETKVYSAPDENSVLKTIPANTKLKVYRYDYELYSGDEYYYTTDQFFVKVSDVVVDTSTDEEEQVDEKKEGEKEEVSENVMLQNEDVLGTSKKSIVLAIGLAVLVIFVLVKLNKKGESQNSNEEKK